jgi:hypothetical protein
MNNVSQPIGWDANPVKMREAYKSIILSPLSPPQSRVSVNSLTLKSYGSLFKRLKKRYISSY